MQDFITEKNTENLRNEVTSISMGKIQFATLRPETKTTSLIDNFYHSYKKYLMLSTAIRYYSTSPSKYYYIDFLIAKHFPRVFVKNPNLTITELKKESDNILSNINNPRLTPLIEEINDIIIEKEVEILTINMNGDLTEEILPLNVPILFHAQTFDNQTGYGNEFRGDKLVYEGTKYGETTKFLIIGFKLR